MLTYRKRGGFAGDISSFAEALFMQTTDEFTVRVASKPEDIKALLEVGFEFVCEKDELLYFRKRK